MKMHILTIEPHDPKRFNTYGYLFGAMQALSRPHETSPHDFMPGEQILRIEDINDIVTIHYRSKAALVQYSGLLVEAWKRVAESLKMPFLRHSTPDGALVIGDPNYHFDTFEPSGMDFKGTVYPKDYDRHVSLRFVMGALQLSGNHQGYGEKSPILLGRHISRMGWESGVVFVEWNSAESFLAYGHVAMYAWRVAGSRPAPGTIRHSLPDGNRIECNLWEESPWKRVVNSIERSRAR
ncbi:hypothetical protein [Paraburkholderia sp. J69-2]|uniref:hypothetical protein n=2 Tax=unclassified Paraburkholderia TaxID=2615204 RepID=UPI002AB1C640|nr:hypothetical protein [Paraburkholderia sp. J69-2]